MYKNTNMMMIIGIYSNRRQIIYIFSRLLIANMSIFHIQHDKKQNYNETMIFNFYIIS